MPSSKQPTTRRATMSTLTSHAHDQQRHSVFARRPILTAVVVGVGSLLPHALLTREASLGLAAVLVALIAGIYFGFAVVNGSGRHQMIEFNVTSVFAVAGLLGMLYWPM